VPGYPRLRFAVVALAIAAAGCDGLPGDPHGSLEQALARGSLRVGVIDDPPWVEAAAGKVPDGLEPRLLAAFAADRGLAIEWRRGGSERLFEALAGYELDVVIGGITESNPWQRRVGFSMPYFTSHVVVGIPPGQPMPRELRGLEVAVRQGSGLAQLLEDRGASVAVVDSLRQARGAVMPVESLEEL
jgi:ABC-type amino acid transport substrate-binding protein